MNTTPRLPNSAKVLQAEVSEIDEDAKFEGENLDGVGSYRTLKIETGDPERMAEAIKVVAGMGTRLQNVTLEDGVIRASVTFGREGEDESPYGLRSIWEALENPREPFPTGEEVSGGQVDDLLGSQPAKKTAAKKTAKKTAKKPE